VFRIDFGHFRWLMPRPVDGRRLATGESLAVRVILIAIALLFLGLFLLLPVAAVFYQALRKGLAAYLVAISQPDAWSAIRLTLLTAAIVVPFNLAFGLAAAWAIARFEFIGKNILITLIDLPFAVSPVIAGMLFVLLLGANSPLGAFLAAHGIKIVFATPGIVLATLFVTFPITARELIPIMTAAGSDEEEAAMVLGANGLKMFFRITLPNIKWGTLYSAVLCNARAMGEFGAVSVVSGHIRGLSDTMPLYVELVYNDYNFVAAFAVASLLTLLALITLLLKYCLLSRSTTSLSEKSSETVERIAA